MIIAAVEFSWFTNHFMNLYNFYAEEVFRVLSNLEGPIRIILYNDQVVSDHTLDKVVERKQIFGDFYSETYASPLVFLQALPTDIPIDLYVFTTGSEACADARSYLKEHRSIQISRVHLYFVGKRNNTNGSLLLAFHGIPRNIYFLTFMQIAELPADSLDLSKVDYDFIVKDDSFRAHVFSILKSEGVDVVELKIRITTLLNNILVKRFKGDRELSLRTFFENGDVSGCCEYVKKHGSYKDKSDFRKKMYGILHLFEDNTSWTLFKNEKDDLDTENLPLEELSDEQLEANDDIPYGNFACIPLKTCDWPNQFRNPFRLLGSEECVDILSNGILDICYPRDDDVQTDAFVLQHPDLDWKALMKHNNRVLSRFFCNKLPGHPALWHTVFLYVVATRRFPERREEIFRHIRSLGQREEYFVSLTPHVDLPIVDALEVCFWYLAHVCPVVWPNDVKNVLRTGDFVSGEILDFYRDVYDLNYKRPEVMNVWRLWYEFHTDHKTIFLVLSRYFQHDRVAPGKFETILCRERIEREGSSLLDLKTVLKIYQKYRDVSCFNLYEDLSDLPHTDKNLFCKILCETTVQTILQKIL